MKVEEASASYVVPHASDVFDWQQTTLGEMADFEMGQAPPGSECNKERIGTVFVKAGEFASLYPVEVEWTTKPLKYGKKGDVFICVVGATAGKLNLGIDCAIGRSVAAIRPRKGIDTKFIYYQLQPWVLKLRASSSGSAQGVISKAQLSEIPLLVAPLDQQKRIVAEIEKQFSRLDEAVANLKRVKANLKHYKAAVLKAAVEGRLVETEAERARREGRSYETGAQLLQRILETRRNQWQGKGKYKEPATPDTTNLPELPVGWVWASVDQLTSGSLIGLDRGRDQQNSEGIGVPYVKMNNVTMNGDVTSDDIVHVAASDDEKQRFNLKIDDLLFNTRNSKELVGKVGIVRSLPKDAIYNNNLMRLRLIDGVIPSFICSQMCSDGFRRRMELVKKATTNVAAVYAKDLFPLPLALPPVVEQNYIVAEVERCLSLANETDAQINANLRRAERLRSAILGNAFFGSLGYATGETPGETRSH